MEKVTLEGGVAMTTVCFEKEGCCVVEVDGMLVSLVMEIFYRPAILSLLSVVIGMWNLMRGCEVNEVIANGELFCGGLAHVGVTRNAAIEAAFHLVGDCSEAEWCLIADKYLVDEMIVV